VSGAEVLVPAVLRCDGWCAGKGTVGHIDTAGFLYCDYCGDRRRFSEPCRKLSAGELEALRAGGVVAAF
jgi:hypothetical protein